jgi:imidazolonepropionase-like amidohydrolase
MTLAITGGTCITPWREIPDSLVLCENGRITWVGPRSQNEPPPGSCFPGSSIPTSTAAMATT